MKKLSAILTIFTALLLASCGNLFNGGKDAMNNPHESVDLEPASGYAYGAGTFGDPPRVLRDERSRLLEFNYDQRMDDPAGVNAYDANASGPLGPGYFRIVEGGSNVRSSIYPKAPGIPSYGLNIYAKQISGTDSRLWPSPPKDRVYLDPVTGRFVMPRPAYWSKCETVVNLTAAEIYPPTGISCNKNLVSATLTPVAAKFGNGLNLVKPSIVGNVWVELNNIFGSTLPNAGTMSYWVAMTLGAGIFNFIVAPFSSAGGVDEIYISCVNGVWGHMIRLNTVVESTSTISIASSMHHIYIVWDKNKGLSGGKSIRYFIDNVEAMSTTASIDNALATNLSSFIVEPGTSGLSSCDILFDNLKCWDHVASEDPSWEYNGGAGREDAMHDIYGSNNDYTPSNVQVGYYY